MPQLGEDGLSLLFAMDIKGALQPLVLPSIATGKPSNGFLTTNPTLFAAIKSRKSPIPIPAPCAIPIGIFFKIQLTTFSITECSCVSNDGYF